MNVRVNTAELKNSLSKYLRRIRATHETITVCERNRPIAKLVPLVPDLAAEGERERQELARRARRLGIKLELSPPGARPRDVEVRPEVARDGQTDRATVEWVRGGRRY